MKTFDIELRFGDIDAAGHVHNVKYLDYLEQARVKLMNTSKPDHDWVNEGFVVGENYIKYLKPVYLTDKVQVAIGTDNIGGKSFQFKYEVLANGKVVAEAYSTMVCMNFRTKTTINIPTELRTELEKIKI